MPVHELTDDEIKADILNRLARRRCWEERHAQTQKITSSLGKRIKRDGARVSRIVGGLVEDGFIVVHKRGRTVSLNPRRSREIMEFIDKHLGF
jgi:DNA-binding MarR family transcriptional regulator